MCSVTVLPVPVAPGHQPVAVHHAQGQPDGGVRVDLAADQRGAQLNRGALEGVPLLDGGDFICSGFDGHADSLAGSGNPDPARAAGVAEVLSGQGLNDFLRHVLAGLRVLAADQVAVPDHIGAPRGGVLNDRALVPQRVLYEPRRVSPGRRWFLLVGEYGEAAAREGERTVVVRGAQQAGRAVAEGGNDLAGRVGGNQEAPRSASL